MAAPLVSPVLVARGTELASLTAALGTRPVIATVEGPAGVGKTRLVGELLGTASHAGTRVLTGRCQEIREPFPLGPVLDAVRAVGADLPALRVSPVAGALRPLLPELAHLLPPTPEPLEDRSAARHRVFRGLAELLRALGPATVVLEDLHWADAQTLDFIRYLLADPPPELAVVTTYRGDEASPVVRAVTAGVPAAVNRVHVTVAPLDVAGTAELTAAILGVDRVSPEFAGFLWERTTGLPYAVEEVLALVRDRGLLVPHGSGGWSRRALRELEVPRRIRDSTLARVDRLPVGAVRLVEAAAVLAVPAVATELAAMVSGEAAAELVERVEEVLGSGLLAEEAGLLSFRHPLAAQAVYDSLSGPRRRQLHDRAATALRQRDQPPVGRLAHHLRHAGRVDEWAGTAEQAADRAVELSNDEEAVRLLEAVLRSGAVAGEQRHRLLLKLGAAAQRTLHAGRIVDLLSGALDDDLPTPVRGELRLMLAHALNQTGDDMVRQHELFATAVADLDHRPDLQAWAMVALGIPTAPGVTPAEHREWLNRCLALVARLDQPLLEAHMLGKATGALLQLGDPWWRTALERLRELTPSGPRHAREINAYYSAGLEAGFTGHVETATELLTTGLAALTGAEGRKPKVLLRSGIALTTFAGGPWTGLQDEVDALVEELAEYPRDRLDVEVVAGCLALATGDVDLAVDRLDAVVAEARRIAAHQVMPLAAGTLARAYLARGDTDAALAAADALIATLEAKQLWAPAGWGLPGAVEALLAAGEDDRARELLASCSEQLSGLDAPLTAAALRHAEGTVAVADGRWPEAATLLEEARSAYRDLGCGYLEAQAAEALAAVGFRTGEARAPEWLQAAITTYRELGASRDEARAGRLAREHGVQPAARHGGGRRSYGTELSPQERKVAELAAVGRTNREIAAELYLSPNTVDKHMRAVMRKLGVRTRTAVGHVLSGRKTGELTP